MSVPPEHDGARTFARAITRALTMLSVTSLALCSTAIYFGVRHALSSHLDAALLSMVRTEISSAVDDPGGVIHVHEPYRSQGVASFTGYEKWAQIVSPSGEILARTENLAGNRLVFDARELGATLGAAPAAGKPELASWAQTQARFSDGQVNDERVRCVFYPLAYRDHGRLVAMVAMSLGPMQASLNTMLLVIVGALLLTTWASALVARRLAASLARPLQEVAATASRVSGANLAERITSTSDLVEVRALVGVVNEMLERVESSFVRQQRFMADASHELRSPLTNLRGTVEVTLRRERTPDDYRATLDLVLGESIRLSRLVSHLLALTRHDAAALASDAVADLDLSVGQSVRLHEARARAGEVELCTAPAPAGSLRVCAAPDEVRQVLDNLLDNALRVAPPRSGITLSMLVMDGMAGVSVTDEGPGIPADRHEAIFEPFTRLDFSRSRDAGGAGLGLAIVRSLVTSRGGRVEVVSEVGRGATMRVLWPAASGG